MLRNDARCFRSVITEVQKLGRLNLVLIYLFDNVLILSRLITAHCKYGISILKVKHHKQKWFKWFKSGCTEKSMAELYETTTTCSYLSYKNGGPSSIKHRDTCKIYKTMILLNKNQWKPWKSTDLYVFSHRLAFVCSLKLIINHFSYCQGFSQPTIFF